jgi:hypothetical protein
MSDSKIIAFQSTFVVEGKIIHRLLQLKSEIEYTILISGHSFSFTKPQILLLSITAFEHFENTSDPFEIVIPSHLSSEQVMQCFLNIYNLFSVSKEIEITFTELPIYEFLAKELDN